MGITPIAIRHVYLTFVGRGDLLPAMHIDVNSSRRSNSSRFVVRAFFLAMGILIALAGNSSADTRPVPASTPPRDTRVLKPFRVVIANDPRLPSVSKETIRQALDIATNWIEVWYRKRIRFEIDRTVAVDSYLAGYFNRLPIPAQWNEYPYALDGTDTVLRFYRSQSEIIRDQSLDALRAYVPPAVRPLITTYEEAAYNMLMLYDAKVRLWKKIRTPGGVPFFNTSFPIQHSYWHWDRAFESVWPDSVTDNLIVTNVLLIDDSLSDAPPHSLIRGGLLNGFADEECAQAVVSTFPVFTDIPAVSELRDTSELTPQARVLALAHIIAHEVGTHVIQGYKDIYDHRACLAVPTSGLAYAQTLTRLFDGKPCALDHPKLDRRGFLADRYDNLAHRYIEIKNYALAKEALRRVIQLDPKRPLVKTLLRQIEKK